MDERSKKIGVRIRDIRKSRRMTQEDLADRLGVTRQQMGRLEAGHRTLRPAVLERIAAALQVSLGTLEDEEDRVASVEEKLRVLGFSVSGRQVVSLPGGDTWQADLVASLRRGPVEMRQVVMVRTTAMEQEVRDFISFVARSRYDRGLCVLDVLPPEALRAEAERGRVTLLLRDDLSLGMADFSAYCGEIEAETESPRYVDPPCVVGEGTGQGQVVGFQSFVDDWLADDGGSHLLLLGEPGVGKTAACRYVARNLALNYLRHPSWSSPIPILVPLWRLAHSGTDLKALVFRDLERRGFLHASGPAALDLLLRENHFVLLLDGLDEMPQDVDRNLLVRGLRAIHHLMQDGGRFVLTCRSAVFPVVADLVALLTLPGRDLDREDGEGRSPAGRGLAVAHLQRFDEARIGDYLEKAVGRKKATYLRWLRDTGSLDAAGLPLSLRLVVGHRRGLDHLETVDPFLTALDDCLRLEAMRLCVAPDEIDRALGLRAWQRYEAEVGLPACCWEDEDAPGEDPAIPGLFPSGPDNNLFFTRAEGRGFRTTLFSDYFLSRHLMRAIRTSDPTWSVLDRVWLPTRAALLAGVMVHKDAGLRRRLQRCLEECERAHVRSLAAFLLGLSGQVDTRSCLGAAAGDPAADPVVRWTAAFSLTMLGDCEMLTRLVEGAELRENRKNAMYLRVLLHLLQRRARDIRDPGRRADVEREIERLQLEPPPLAAWYERVEDPTEDDTVRCSVVELLGYERAHDFEDRLRATWRATDSVRLRHAIRNTLEMMRW